MRVHVQKPRGKGRWVEAEKGTNTHRAWCLIPTRPGESIYRDAQPCTRRKSDKS